MPAYKRKEFAELCGVSDAYLTMYIKRGKVFLGDDKRIDSELPMNADFIAKSKDKKEKPSSVAKEKTVLKSVEVFELIEDEVEYVAPKVVAKVAPIKKERQKKEPVPHFDISNDRTQEAIAKYNLDTQIKQAELEKKEQEIELNRLKIAKITGEVIPTDLIKIIFNQHSKSITTAFHQGCDNFITTIVKQTGMSREEMASIRGQLIEIVNESVRAANEESKMAVKHVVGEYAEKRGQGEKK